jgi:hypothetical protein
MAEHDLQSIVFPTLDETHVACPLLEGETRPPVSIRHRAPTGPSHAYAASRLASSVISAISMRETG